MQASGSGLLAACSIFVILISKQIQVVYSFCVRPALLRSLLVRVHQVDLIELNALALCRRV